MEKFFQAWLHMARCTDCNTCFHAGEDTDKYLRLATADRSFYCYEKGLNMEYTTEETDAI